MVLYSFFCKEQYTDNKIIMGMYARNIKKNGVILPKKKIAQGTHCSSDTIQQTSSCHLAFYA
jgi:hypothetical protein